MEQELVASASVLHAQRSPYAMKLIVGLGQRREEIRKHAAQRGLRRAGPRRPTRQCRRRRRKEKFDGRTMEVTIGGERGVVAVAAHVDESQRPERAGGRCVLPIAAGRLVGGLRRFQPAAGQAAVSQRRLGRRAERVGRHHQAAGFARSSAGCGSASARCQNVGTRPILCWGDSDRPIAR